MSSCSSTLSPSQILVSAPQPISDVDVSPTSSQRPLLKESQKCPYQAAQQVKFLHLEAEIESLLQQLQALKQQRTASEAVGKG